MISRPIHDAHFPHRARAAFFAASRSFFFPSFFARAGPPFSPPLRPRATAAGSFAGFSFSRGPTGSLVTASKIAAAVWLMSSTFGFRLGRCFGMLAVCGAAR